MLLQFQRDGRVIGDRNQNWQAAVDWINQSPLDPNTPVFVRSGLIEAEQLRGSEDQRLRAYCLFPVRGIYPLRQDDRDLIPLPTTGSGRLSPAQQRRLSDAGTAWFLLAGRPETVSHIENELLSGWQGRTEQPSVVERRAFGDLALLRFEVDVARTPARKAR
jgi:hypothetical protein